MTPKRFLYGNPTGRSPLSRSSGFSRAELKDGRVGVFGRGDREHREKVESSHEPHEIQPYMTMQPIRDLPNLFNQVYPALLYSSPDSPDLHGEPHLTLPILPISTANSDSPRSLSHAINSRPHLAATLCLAVEIGRIGRW